MIEGKVLVLYPFFTGRRINTTTSVTTVSGTTKLSMTPENADSAKSSIFRGKPTLCNELSALLDFTPGADTVAALVLSSIERGIRSVQCFINAAQ